MINIKKSKNAFNTFLKKYGTKTDLGFELKVAHTYHVVNNAKEIATKLNLSKEDVELAQLIALLHDIGRFEEIAFYKRFDNRGFDHASYGIKMLFEDNLIRDFIDDSSYDEIIKIAINNHSRLAIEDGLSGRELTHSKILRDADKLDNFRVKMEEKIEAIFPGKIKIIRDIEDSTLTKVVYDTVKSKKCVSIYDRITPLDYWVCVLAFIFDLNYKETYMMVKEKDYINILIDKFKYNDLKTKEQMEEVRNILNSFINEKII